MQGTETIKKLRRRHDRRETAAELLAIAENAPKMGSAAKRCYATARIQFTKQDYIKITKLSKMLGMRASDLIREMLKETDEIRNQGKTYGPARKRLLARAKKANDLKPNGRRSAADDWASQEAGQGRNTRGIEIRLSFANIAEIAIEREERKAQGLKASNSRTLAALIVAPRLELESLARQAISRRAADSLGLQKDQEAKAARPRQSRDRAYTEAKRRLMGLDGPAKRGRPKGQAETEQGHGLI